MEDFAPVFRAEDHVILTTVDDGMIGVVLLGRLFNIHSLPLSLVTMVRIGRGTGSVEWGYFPLLQQELRRFECRKVGLDHGVGHPSNSCPEWEQLTH